MTKISLPWILIWPHFPQKNSYDTAPDRLIKIFCLQWTKNKLALTERSFYILFQSLPQKKEGQNSISQKSGFNSKNFYLKFQTLTEILMLMRLNDLLQGRRLCSDLPVVMLPLSLLGLAKPSQWSCGQHPAAVREGGERRGGLILQWQSDTMVAFMFKVHEFLTKNH